MQMFNFFSHMKSTLLKNCVASYAVPFPNYFYFEKGPEVYYMRLLKKQTAVKKIDLRAQSLNLTQQYAEWRFKNIF